jgi:hypothetical protein
MLFICGLLIFYSCAKKKNLQPIESLPEAGALAVLQAGEYPLWFQLGPQGPEQLAAIEDACFSRALVPWPLTPHICFMLVRDNEVFMAANRDGILRFAPWDTSGRTGMYCYSGGEFWKVYTVTAFFFYDDKPAALVYRDDRFFDTGATLPHPRAFTMNTQSSSLEALDIPTLSRFPPSDGWDADALRLSANGSWYYRVIRKDMPQGEILYFRSSSLKQEGESVSIGVFQNSALPEHLSAAPASLLPLFAALSAGGTTLVLSPDFPCPRYFAETNGSQVNILAYYRNTGESPVALAVNPKGRGLYAEVLPPPETENEAVKLRSLALPELPESFVYTGIALSGQNIIAAWEEQEYFNIGAAGFMVMKLPDF